MNQIEQYRGMNSEELHNELEVQRRRLFDLRSQAVTQKLEDPTQLGKTRRNIARLLTVLKQRGETNIEQRQAHLTARAAKR